MVKFIVVNKHKFLLGSILLMLIFLVAFFVLNKKDIDFSQFYSETIIEEGNNYNIKIEYPKFKNKKINNKIVSMINAEIEMFKEKSNKINQSDFTYELNIQYTITNTDRIYSIHFVIYKYLGSTYYERNDLIYYYDYIDNDIVGWDNFFVDNALALEKISYLSKVKLKKDYSKDIYTDKNMFEAGISPKKNNYKYILYTEDGINIIFPPYQVGPWLSGEISINISYNDINDILIGKYQIEDIDSVDAIDSYKRKTRDIKELKGKKLISLTFDDGPSWNTTEKLLDGLRERDAKVTFFVLGNMVKQLPHVVKKAYDDGHTIGSHTYSHKNLRNLTDEEIKSETDKANDEIEKAIGKRTNIIRPPYGEFKKSTLNMSNITFILWNVDTNDWKYKDTETIYNHIIDSARDGNIILLHDIYNASVEATLMAIDKLLEEGYAFVSIEELEQLGKLDLSGGNYYYKIK